MLRTLAVLLTFAASSACGKPDVDEPTEAPPRERETVARDTIARTDGRARPEAAEPPADLAAEIPAEFPISPGSTTIEARTIPEGGGRSSRITLVESDSLTDTVEWYATALEDAGWRVTGRDTIGDRVALSAIRGESYAEIEIEPAGGARNRTEVRARIWTPGP